MDRQLKQQSFNFDDSDSDDDGDFNTFSRQDQEEGGTD